MQEEQPNVCRYSHAYGQDRKRPGESRTLAVIMLTGAMMVVEVAAGIIYGSMALLADGLHMASHAVALGITAFAYIYARRHARDERFSFGTGKVNTLGGYTGAVLLAIFAAIMMWESLVRLVSPVPIAYDQAIFVAVLGLLVNGASVLILGLRPGHREREGDHGHDHVAHHHEDYNLRSAYLHVFADALTSLLAIFALLAAKYVGLAWADPAMGLVGGWFIVRWSVGLLRKTTEILLDRQGPAPIRKAIMNSIERDSENRVVDLHVWAVGPNVYTAVISLITATPRPPDHYKHMLPADIVLDHVTVEVHSAHDAHARNAHSLTSLPARTESAARE
jgi:cation diffusion facilitator family transporter